MRWPLVSSVPKLVYATASNLVRSNIDQLVWESYHKCVVLSQECSTKVEVHHSYQKLVSSILQQCVVDDLRLVAVGTQHHDSRHKTFLEKRLLWKRSQLLLAAIWQLIRNPGLAVAGKSVCLGNLSVPISPFALRKLPCLSVLMVSTHRRSISCSKSFVVHAQVVVSQFLSLLLRCFMPRKGETMLHWNGCRFFADVDPEPNNGRWLRVTV